MKPGIIISVLLAGLLTVALIVFLSGSEEQPPAQEMVVRSTYQDRLDELVARVQADDTDTLALVELGRMYQDAHQAEEAVLPYRRYLELRPANRQVWLDLANCLAETGRWLEAREATLALLRRAPDDASALYNLGAIEANLGNEMAARDAWGRLVRARTDSALVRQATQSLAQLGSP